MPVVVEIANDWHLQSLISNALHDLRDRRRRRFVIHRNADDLTPSTREVCNLCRRTNRVGGVGIRH
jgi:hypothetical protein